MRLTRALGWFDSLDRMTLQFLLAGKTKAQQVLLVSVSVAARLLPHPHRASHSLEVLNDGLDPLLFSTHRQQSLLEIGIEWQ